MYGLGICAAVWRRQSEENGSSTEGAGGRRVISFSVSSSFLALPPPQLLSVGPYQIRSLRPAIRCASQRVDNNPAYPAAVEALKADGAIPGRVALRQCKYLNNVIEQGHRTVKKRVWLAKGCGLFHSAWRTLQGISEHDAEGSSEMAGQRRCCRPSSLNRRAIRTLCLS